MLAEILIYIIALVLRADIRVPGDGHHGLFRDCELVEDLVSVGEKKILQKNVVQAPLLQPQKGGQAGGDREKAKGVPAVPL